MTAPVSRNSKFVNDDEKPNVKVEYISDKKYENVADSLIESFVVDQRFSLDGQQSPIQEQSKINNSEVVGFLNP